jgi:hypothetical protein
MHRPCQTLRGAIRRTAAMIVVVGARRRAPHPAFCMQNRRQVHILRIGGQR